MKPKTILFLGAATFQTPPILYARDAGYRIITCDNRPNNPGHQLAHVRYDVSTLDASRILEIAQNEAIDGILTFGSDISAPTAAFVAEEMGLPGNPPDSIRRLCQKHVFRDCLDKARIQPSDGAFFDASAFDEAVAFASSFAPGDAIIKPVDASGSKGVFIISSGDDLRERLNAAFATSVSSRVIIEERIPAHGYQICGDGYFQDGEIVFVQYGNGHFYNDSQRLAPYGETFPSAHPQSLLDATTSKLGAALRACGFVQGPFNLDVLVDARDRSPFIVEIGPRAGGNYLPSTIRYQTGVDMIEAAVEGCLSASYRFRPRPAHKDVFHSSFMLHATAAGTYRGFALPDDLPARLLEQHPYISVGDSYRPFVNAADSVGNLILEFDDYERMLHSMNRPESIARLL